MRQLSDLATCSHRRNICLCIDDEKCFLSRSARAIHLEEIGKKLLRNEQALHHHRMPWLADRVGRCWVAFRPVASFRLSFATTFRLPIYTTENTFDNSY